MINWQARIESKQVKPFPLRCMHCRTENVYPTVVSDYYYWMDEKEIHISNVDLLKCTFCGGGKWIKETQDQIIKGIQANTLFSSTEAKL